MRESQVAKALKRRLEFYGCDWRRVEWIGRHSCPDFFALLTPKMSRAWSFPRNPWVETKRPTKDANEAQGREHVRMRDHGEIVLVIRDLETLDRWFPALPPVNWRDYELSVKTSNTLQTAFPGKDLAYVATLTDLELRRAGLLMRGIRELREIAANFL